jgi:RNA polymerase sigma-70 factor (ECF subfamily)
MDASDAAAVALARTGDGDAFRLLVERHGRRVFRLAFRLTGNQQDAEDVVQDTFLRAYRTLDRFEEQALVITWLVRIATNCALDVLRRRRVRAPHLAVAADEGGSPISERVASPQPGPERLVLGSEVQQRIARALEELTPHERAAFTLRHFEERTIAEISETLSISANATKQAVFRAVQKMRKALQLLDGETTWET